MEVAELALKLKSPELEELVGEQGGEVSLDVCQWLMSLMMDPSQLLYEATELGYHPNLLRSKIFMIVAKGKVQTMPFAPRDS